MVKEKLEMNFAALGVNLFFGYLGKMATSGASIVATYALFFDIALIGGEVSGDCSKP